MNSVSSGMANTWGSQSDGVACLRLVRRNWKSGAAIILVVACLYFLYSTHQKEPHASEEPHWPDELEAVMPWGGNVSYALSPDSLCLTPPTLLIIVISAPWHTEARQVIRTTWGSIANSSALVRLAFLVGNSTKSNKRDLLVEHKEHSDIIFANFDDSYRNLTIKSITMLHWVSTHCPATKYLLKADDDMFINVPNLLARLQNTVAKRYILGLLFHGATPILDKSSKWYSPNFPHKTYPDYVSGTAYVISGDLIKSLFTVAVSTPLFWLEDIFITGICGSAVGATLIGDNAFSCNRRELTWCAFKNAISGHEYTSKEILQIWNDFQKSSHLPC